MNGDKSVEEIKKTAVGAEKEAVQEVKESVEATAEDMENVPEVHFETPEADVEVTFIDDRDKEAEGLIHWAAARAGVIVAAPLLGTVSLIANEVYMISKIGSVYGVDVPQKAVLSFIGSLGATVVGTTVATLLPIPFIQIPIGISVTYGLGKAAVRWIKDGMPDDTRPYKAVFEEGRAEGNTLVGEIKENPEKDIPLGDEKRDFTKEIKETVDDVYPEKAHEAVDKLADQLVDTFNLLGEQLVTALKKAGMTDEQIEKAKYTTIGAAEIAKETAEKTAKNLRAVARVKSRKLQEEARQKASEMKEQAKEQMEELQKKKEEMRRQSEIRAEQAKLKSEKLKAQVRIQMQEAKVQADKLKEQVRTQAEIAQDKANELKEKVNARADDYRRNVSAAANRAKADILGYVDDFRTKTEERAAQIGQKIVMQREGLLKAVNFLRKLLGNLLKRQKNKGFKPAPDITGLNKEHHRDVVWRPVSPWSKRRWRFKRTNHPWFKKR